MQVMMIRKGSSGDYHLKIDAKIISLIGLLNCRKNKQFKQINNNQRENPLKKKFKIHL